MRKPSLILATALTLATALAQARENDALPVSRAKIPLAQAVTAAEEHVHGRAARAEYEKSKLGWVYDVEVVSGGKVYDVKIDAEKGTVLASTEDKTDHDDDGDRED